MITYASSTSFSLPRWFGKRLSEALRRHGMTDRLRTSLNSFIALSQHLGVTPDHIGRKGDAVTLEPYATAVNEEALRRLAEELRCEVAIGGESEWNPHGEGFGVPTVLVELKGSLEVPKRDWQRRTCDPLKG